VRIGETFQIAGKWCFFVAVSANEKEFAEKKEKGLTGQDFSDAETLKGNSSSFPTLYHTCAGSEANRPADADTEMRVSSSSPEEINSRLSFADTRASESTPTLASASRGGGLFGNTTSTSAKGGRDERGGLFGSSASAASPRCEQAAPSTSTSPFGTCASDNLPNFFGKIRPRT